jgi:uncharacterized repeat protein (TIGR03803 family)
MDATGNLYGTTTNGGTIAKPCPGTPGCGTVFKLDPSGTESVLHSFQDSPDGANPFAGLIMDTAGNLYGTTTAGGISGTVFKLGRSGTESVLYSFKGAPDGGLPYAGLIMDTAGNLYGTTANGGVCQFSGGCGTVFKLDPSGSESVLYSFKGPPDGAFPEAGLIMDAAGNLYGTTRLGGAFCGPEGGCGTVFKLDPSGGESVLYSFKGSPDGANPFAGLIMDTAGNLYGTTASGGFTAEGCNPGCGTVFKLDPSGTESLLYSFKDLPDGDSPMAGLIMDAAGNLYGTTIAGGTIGQNQLCNYPPVGCGTIFKLDPSGTESVLYSFEGSLDGWAPLAGLIMDMAGTLYGTAYVGGFTGGSCPLGLGCGTVFKLSPFTFAGLISLVKQFTTDPGAEESMMRTLKLAEGSAAKGDQKAVDRMLRTFIRQVSAQSGKFLTSANAATLIQEAKSLMG